MSVFLTKHTLAKTIGCTVLLSCSISATASVKGNFNQCKETFYNKQAPKLDKTTSKQNLYALCFNGFAVMYSGQTRTPLWSAEYLTKQKIKKASRVERDDSFHSESRIPKKFKANLKHYSNSGYDRGHLAPNANMANKKEQYDSFSLANIVPQSPNMNRSVWKQIESDVRTLTKKYDKVYTITGALFESPQTGTRKNRLKNAVEIPSHMYKAVYISTANKAGVYIAPNDESQQMQMISFDDFSKRTGIDLMPNLPSQYSNVANLPVSDLASLTDPSNEPLNQPQQQPNQQQTDTDNTQAKTDKSWLISVVGAIVVWLVDKFVFTK